VTEPVLSDYAATLDGLEAATLDCGHAAQRAALLAQ
jgi:hypothetical protein